MEECGIPYFLTASLDCSLSCSNCALLVARSAVSWREGLPLRELLADMSGMDARCGVSKAERASEALRRLYIVAAAPSTGPGLPLSPYCPLAV